MKKEHKERLQSILDKYDDRIKEAEIRMREYEEQAVQLTRERQAEMYALINDMATWKMGQLFAGNGQLWKVTDIRSCTTSLYCDLEVAYTVTAVNSKGKDLSEVYQVNLSEEDIQKNNWQPVTDRKDVYVLPAQIFVKEIKLVKEVKRSYLYLIKDTKGKYYTFEYVTSFLTSKEASEHTLLIKRRMSGHSMITGRYYAYIRYFNRGKFRSDYEVKNLQPVKKDDKKLIAELVEGLV